jgi:hypothetical protein
MLCFCRGSREVVERKKESIQIWCPSDMEGDKKSQWWLIFLLLRC